MLLEMFFLNVLWQATKRTWNSDMCTVQIQIGSVKQELIVKEGSVINRMEYAVRGGEG